jgi:hypothetical protein
LAETRSAQERKDLGESDQIDSHGSISVRRLARQYLGETQLAQERNLVKAIRLIPMILFQFGDWLDNI